jgi:hypothetical protein
MKNLKIFQLILFLTITSFLVIGIQSCEKHDNYTKDFTSVEEINTADTESSIINNYEAQNNFSFNYYGLFHNEVCLFLLEKTRDLPYTNITERVQVYKDLVKSEYGYSASTEDYIDSNGELIEVSFENATGLTESEISVLLTLQRHAEIHEWNNSDAIFSWKAISNLIAENAIIDDSLNLKRLLAIISIAKHSGELWALESGLYDNVGTQQRSLHCTFVSLVSDAAYASENCTEGMDAPCVIGTSIESAASYNNCEHG